MKDVKGRKQKLSNMQGLVRHVERAAGMVNLCHLVKRDMRMRDVLDLYHVVKHLFKFPSLMSGKQGRLTKLKCIYFIVRL